MRKEGANVEELRRPSEDLRLVLAQPGDLAQGEVARERLAGLPVDALRAILLRDARQQRARPLVHPDDGVAQGYARSIHRDEGLALWGDAERSDAAAHLLATANGLTDRRHQR